MREAGNSYKRGLGHSIDWSLIICYLILVFVGWLNIYASVHSTNPSSIFDLDSRCGKQFLWILTSIGLAVTILFVLRPQIWEVISVPSYLFLLVLLVLVIFVSKDTKGSHSWFELGPIKFQPAEISKITTSMVLAMVMSKSDFKMSRIKDFCLVALIIGIPMLTIIAESETGSALVYVGFIFMLYREGLSGWLLMMIGVAILLFITTLTMSPFASMMILLFICSISCALVYKQTLRWFMIELPLFVFLSFLPKLYIFISDLIVPGAAILDKVDESVRCTIVNNSDYSFLLNVNPIWFLFVILIAGLPFIIRKAYKEKMGFIAYSIAGLALGIALIFSTQFLFNKVLEPHQRGRIEVLLGMKEDLAGIGYNVNQSKIAIGSGGLFGKGFLHGTQTTYGFVPEQSTDFIFCTVGEEWGFAGCMAVILLYTILIWRIVHDAEKSRESFTRIYGYCVACCIFMHLFINIGMTIGLMPVIGIPLPLLSYGGSSLWAFTILIFIFIALDKEDKKYF